MPAAGRNVPARRNTRTQIVSGPPATRGPVSHRWNHREDEDYYTQPGLLFGLMSDEQKRALFQNTARSMGGIPAEIKIRHIVNCFRADPAYGEGIAAATGIPMREVPLEPAPLAGRD